MQRVAITHEAVLERLRLLAFSPIKPAALGGPTAGDQIRALEILGRYLNLWQGGGGEAKEHHYKEIVFVDRRPTVVQDTAANSRIAVRSP